MKLGLNKNVRLVRDVIIDILFMFVGFLYLTKAWPRPEVLIGVVFILAGVLIAMKVNMSPYSDCSPKATLSAYFSPSDNDTNSRRRLLQRISLLFLVVPFLFFLPVVFAVGDVEKMQGYMVVSFGLFLASVFCAIAGFLTYKK